MAPRSHPKIDPRKCQTSSLAPTDPGLLNAESGAPPPGAGSSLRERSSNRLKYLAFLKNPLLAVIPFGDCSSLNDAFEIHLKKTHRAVSLTFFAHPINDQPSQANALFPPQPPAPFPEVRL